MRDVIKHLRRRKSDATQTDSSTKYETTQGSIEAESVTDESEEKQAKRWNEILWEIGYVE